ncbi:MAG TPA: hypothetical protein VGK30_15805 [Candidatus Binatia bacterium]|jgi:hypothetical protein
MITESFLDTRSTVRDRRGQRLAADLAEDPADLLDLAAALRTEVRSVVAAMLRTPERDTAEAIRGLATSKRPQARLPSGGRAPFVWVTIVPPGVRAPRTVRAGWLSSSAVEAIAAEARAVGDGTEIRIIVPLDGGDDTAARVHALCLGFPLDLKVTIDVQRDGTSRHAVETRREQRAVAGTWIVLDPAGATP